jgi:glutaredoxin-related protein
MTSWCADFCSDTGTQFWGSLENIKKLLDIVEIMASTADKLTFLHVFEAVMGIIGTKGAES